MFFLIISQITILSLLISSCLFNVCHFQNGKLFFYIHYDGGNLPDAEQVTTSVTKVKLDKGATVHFSLNKSKKI